LRYCEGMKALDRAGYTAPRAAPALEPNHLFIPASPA